METSSSASLNFGWILVLALVIGLLLFPLLAWLVAVLSCWGTCCDALVRVVRSVEGVLPEPPPEVFTLDLGDSAANVKLRVWWWTEPQREMVETHDRVMTAIKARLQQFNVGAAGQEARHA